MSHDALRQLRGILFVPFFFFSFCWAVAYRVWRTQKRRSASPPVLPTISVGNIHAGGSAKTPVVLAIAQYFADRSPAILSRGYGGKLSRVGSWVDLTLPEGPSLSGDEPWLLAQKSGCPVWVGKHRSVGAREAAQQGRKLLVLDDGFQHLALARDVDLVTIHTSRSHRELFCLPLGELREPFESLRDADAVILAGDHPEREAPWRSLLSQRFPRLPIFSAGFVHDGYWDGDRRFDNSHQLCAAGFCGIANPDRFRSKLESDFTLIDFAAFADHYAWDLGELRKLADEARTRGASVLVCTEKDWVKLAPLSLPKDVQWIHARIRYHLDEPCWNFIESRLGQRLI